MNTFYVRRELAFGRLRTSSEDFRLLQESLEMIVSSSKMIKISHLYLRKIWQLYYRNYNFFAACASVRISKEVRV